MRATHRRAPVELETTGFAAFPGSGSSAGVGCLAVRSYAEVARELGVSRQAVRQAEVSALRKARRLLEAQGFKSSLAF